MTRLLRFQRELGVLGADGAIISSELNIRYLCGFAYTDGYLLVLRDRAFLLTDFRYAEAARLAVSGFEVIVPTDGMLSAINALAKENKAAVIAIEDADVSVSSFSKMRDAMPDISLATAASDVLTEMRTVKDADELSLIIKAQSITDAAFDHILGFITPDKTEREVALELEFFMRRHGAEACAFDTIAVSGASSSLPHGVPSDKRLSRGFLTMDFGAKYAGYCSDMTRTVVIGKADDEMKNVYDTVLRAQLAALEALHEGIGCREADAVARNVINAAGYGNCFGHSLGHGVGLYIHEAPSFSPKAKEDSVLRRGNVVTVEPGIYIEGKYGVRIEDMIALAENGEVINLTHSPKNLIEI